MRPVGRELCLLNRGPGPLDGRFLGLWQRVVAVYDSSVGGLRKFCKKMEF